MYKCELCGKQSEPRQKANRKVLSTRQVTHTDRFFNLETNRWKEVRTNGTQIVKEVVCCAECVKENK